MAQNKNLQQKNSPHLNSILVVSKTGIYRLFCPFKAICIKEVASYTIGQQVTVISIKIDNSYRLIYIIQNKGFYHSYFMITNISFNPNVNNS